jgi:phosphoglycerol transferase MdoB-like AlkP superfamily enzyme
LVIYTICRLFFYIINSQAFNFNSFYELLRAFYFGIRFDIAAIASYNSLFILLYLLPFNFVHNRYYKRIVNILFYTSNFFLILFNFTDIEYFKYTGKRSTADLFNYIFLSNDTATLLPQFLKDFWYIALIYIGSVVGGLYAMTKPPFRNIEKHHFNVRSWILAGVSFILVLGLFFAGARGTGLKPIRIISAGRYTSTQNIPLVLNTPFTIWCTVQDETIRPIKYFDEKELYQIYTPEQYFTTDRAKRTDNVMVIILESFSKEFVGLFNGGKGYTPCLDSIIKNGLVFENAFANGKRSIEAVPAIFAGLPAFTDDSYISTRFSGNQLLSLPAILAQNGYHTSFFHGGRNGTMGFDEFCHIAGVKHYYGLNEYKGPKAFDGNWGIYDEEFLQYYARELNTFPQPFFTTVFTVSSHHPYRIPDKYKNDFKDTPNELVRSIRYADYSLGKFFQTISKAPWFKNTLFIFSADHTAKEQSKLYGTRAGMFRIPIAYYHPGDTVLTGIRARITQQADVMPSVLDYLGINKPFLAFGSSIFSNTDGYAANFLGGIYQYFHGNYMLTFDGEKTMGLYNILEDRMLKKNLVKDSTSLAKGMETTLKAMIQQYNYRLLNNKMVNAQ